MLFKRVVIAIVVVVLGACADQGRRLKSDFDRLDQGITDVRALQAEQTTRLAALEGELRALSGRVEELEYSQTQRFGSEIGTIKRDLSNLRTRVPPHSAVPVEALAADEKLSYDLPPEISGIFQDALLKIREGAFADAEVPLKEAHELSNGTEWAPNIQFWFAVVHDGKGDYRKALAAYNEFFTRYKKHSRAPLALYRQALVLSRLGDSKTAKLTLNKLLAEYPKSAEAPRAKEKLKDL